MRSWRCGRRSKEGEKERIARDPLRWLPTSFSSAIVWTARGTPRDTQRQLAAMGRMARADPTAIER